MKNKDVMNAAKTAALTNLAQAMQGDDEQAIATALSAFCGTVRDELMDEARSQAGIAVADNAAMAARGQRPLTSAENAYYNAVIAAAKSADPKNAIANINVAMPQTIIENVIGTVKRNHPLLDKLNFVNTTYLTSFIVNAKGAQTAAWGAIGSAISQELSGALSKIDVTMLKLAACMALPLDYLELGPAWLNEYVVETLSEAIALALESAVVDGDGKGKPIGMTRDISSSASVVAGVQPRQTATALANLTPEELGKLVKKIARDPADATKARPVADLVFLVNPFTYWEKIFPATCYRRPDGTWIRDVLPIPADIIQTAALDATHAVLGMPSRYFVGLGLTGKDGLLSYSDEAKFLDDERLYKTKLQGNGRPMDEYAFLYLDISNLAAVVPTPVTVKGTVSTKAETAAIGG